MSAWNVVDLDTGKTVATLPDYWRALDKANELNGGPLQTRPRYVTAAAKNKPRRPADRENDGA